MQTITEFVSACNLPESLARAVIRQVGGWASFRELAKDVTNHGADAGVSGFIYYVDTEAFFRRNKAAILECAAYTADNFGESTTRMISRFQCLKCEESAVLDAITNSRTKDPEGVRNALAWFALEEVSRAYCDALETA